MTTTLIVGPFASGKTRTLREHVAGPTIAIWRPEDAASAAARIQAGEASKVLIDDCDTLEAHVLSKILIACRNASAEVIATARHPVKGFETAHMRSVSHLPSAHQKLVSLAYGIFRTCVMETTSLLVLQPIETPSNDQKARCAAALLHRRLQTETLCLGPCPSRLKMALLELEPTARFSGVEAAYGRRARSVMVFMMDLPQAELLEALTRSDAQLTVVFCSETPPEELCRIRQLIQPLIPADAPWINWEGYAAATCRRPKRKREEYGADIVPKTVTALVRRLVDDAHKMRLGSVNEVLQMASDLLGWKSVPKHTVVQSKSDLLHTRLEKRHGVAAELVLARSLAFVEPVSQNIVLPDAVHHYRRAVYCNDPVFLMAWAASASSLRKTSQSADAWQETFSSNVQWGHVSADFCRRVASSALPIVILPETLRSACDRIESAVADYIDPNNADVARHHVELLAALVQVVEHGSRDYTWLLADNLSEYPYERMFDRCRHFWCLMGSPSYITPQVSVRAGLFRGFCDYVSGETSLVELKCSGAQSFDAQAGWALQAAIYSYHLKRQRAYWFNVNTNEVGRLDWNANHFV